VRYQRPFGRWTAAAAVENPEDIPRAAAGGTGEVAAIGTVTPSGSTNSWWTDTPPYSPPHGVITRDR